MELREYRERLVIKELKADKDLEELLAFLDQLLVLPSCYVDHVIYAMF